MLTIRVNDRYTLKVDDDRAPMLLETLLNHKDFDFSPRKVDHGIGSYEYWGFTGTHTDVHLEIPEQIVRIDDDLGDEIYAQEFSTLEYEKFTHVVAFDVEVIDEMYGDDPCVPRGMSIDSYRLCVGMDKDTNGVWYINAY